MIIYNQTPTSKRFIGGMLIGFLGIPAIILFSKGFIFLGILLIIIYLAIETSRTGVNFNFGEGKYRGFREIFFILKIPRTESIQLNTFSHYRVNQETSEATVSANWVQQSTISQEHTSLELFDKEKGEFTEVVKSNASMIQPLLSELEAKNILLKN